MSFEPTLVIRKSDLVKHREIIDKERWDTDEQTARIAKFLMEALDGGSLKFKEIEIIIASPEHTEFNRDVRFRLDDLDVEYLLDM